MRLLKERFRRPITNEASVRMRLLFDGYYLLRMAGEMEYPRHQHSNYEIVLTEKETYRCELNGEELDLDSGQILMIKPGDWHQDHLRTGQSHCVIQFRLTQPEAGAPIVPLFIDDIRPSQQICIGDFNRERMLLRELLDESSKGNAFDCAIQDSLLEVLFWRIVRAFPTEALSRPLRQLSRTEAQREEVASVFSRFVSTNPNVRELADALRISPRTLDSVCHTLFSESPAKLLLRFKLRLADDLLSFQGMRVQEVSDRLGFSNPYHFSRVYHRLRGHAPSLKRKAQEFKNGCR